MENTSNINTPAVRVPYSKFPSAGKWSRGHCFYLCLLVVCLPSSVDKRPD